MSSLETQVGGSHYKTMKMQPVQFAMENNWDFCASSALKYIVRHAGKAGKQDLEKAIHFSELRADLVRGIHARGIPVVDMEIFIALNEITDPSTCKALRALSKWVYAPRENVYSAFGRGYFEPLVAAIKDMIHDHYPVY